MSELSSLPPIPFNRPAVVGREQEYMQQALQSGHLSGDGAFTARCHAMLEAITGAPKVLLTTSCTHALEMAMLLAGIGPDDEVLCPAFTFVSSVNAFVLRGARPVFVDIRPDTLNIDERLVEAAITPRTKALVVVHYAGIGCEMTALMALAERYGLTVVEDNAHGLFGRYHGRELGSFGAMSTLSFHETKNLTCGEGGALVLNDGALVERAEIIREKGTNRSRFYRGQIDKYTWVDVGSSYLPSDLLAAYLCAQLEARELVQARRLAIWDGYDTALAAWADASGIGRPQVPAHCDHPAHIYYLLLPSLEARTRLLADLRRAMVLLTFHYQPLHLSEMGRQFGGREGQCPVTEDVADRLVRLPVFFELSAPEQARIVETLRAFRV